MAAADGQLPGRVLYDVGSPDALAHWLAQHPYVVMLAGSSHLDTYLDTATGALLRQGQVLRVAPRRRDPSDALLRDLHTDTTLVEAVSDGGLPEGGAIDARVRALAGREQIGTVRTVIAPAAPVRPDGPPRLGHRDHHRLRGRDRARHAARPPRDVRGRGAADAAARRRVPRRAGARG